MPFNQGIAIVHVIGSNEQEYQAASCPRPNNCPNCGIEGSLIGHGYYQRKPKDAQQVYRVAIKRWLCKACRKTVTILPDFLLSFRHYLLRTIGQTLEYRFEGKLSWAELKTNCSKAGLPALRTIQRWCKSFGGGASRWLGPVQGTLAEQDSASAWLDAQGEAARAPTAAEALLCASEHLLAWGKTRWLEAAAYGRNERLRFLWLWGANQGLGRLI